jgi:DNA-binding NarL/FixJ family response regulator
MTDAAPSRIRVLIADAHAATLAGLRMAIGGEPFEVVAEASDAAAAIAAARREHPDICILDADMPGGAIDATADIAQGVHSSAVVVLAATRHDAVMLEAVRAGAAGYLLKDINPERLRFALIGVMHGEAALPRTLVARLMLEFRMSSHRRRIPIAGGEAAELTPREWDVLVLMADGASTQEMASALKISDVTVRRHVSGVLAKLQVHDREAAVAVLRGAEQP